MTTLVFFAVVAAGAFAYYLLTNWPAAKRTMFDAHADGALRVVDESDKQEWLDQFCDRLRAEIERQPREDDAEFWRMVHPSSGNGLADLDGRTKP